VEVHLDAGQAPINSTSNWGSFSFITPESSAHGDIASPVSKTRISNSEHEVGEVCSVATNTTSIVSTGANRTVAHMAVFFPLPSETRMESSNVLKKLDSTLFPETTHHGSSVHGASKSLHGCAYVDWEDAKNQGIKLSTALILPSAEGTLHAAVRLIDSSGEPLGVGVIPVPR